MTGSRVPAARLKSQARFLSLDQSAFLKRSEKSLIQWPTQRRIEEVSLKLARISRVAIRWEQRGDYFKSGDLAYQVNEIIQATEELFKKIQRLKG